MPHSASEFLAAATWTGIIPADFLLAERGFGGITLWRSVDDGLPDSMAYERAFGNAIIPKVVARFIAAFTDFAPMAPRQIRSLRKRLRLSPDKIRRPTRATPVRILEFQLEIGDR